MTNKALTDSEATKLFASVSRNLDNPDKLNELLAVEPQQTESPAPEQVPATAEAAPKEPEKEETAQPQDAAPEEPAKEEPKPDLQVELEALRQKYALLEHRIKSDDGRVSVFQRKAQELEAKLAALNSAPKVQPATTRPASAADEPSEVEVRQAMEELKRVDPALHKIMVAQETTLKKELEQLRSTVNTELAPVRDTISSFAADREVEKLRQTITNLADVVASEQFQQYREVAPRIVREWLNSKYAEDVVEGMKAYSLYLHTNGLVPTGTQEAAKPQPAATDKAATTPASPVVSERDRKLSTSVSVTSPPAAPVRKELSDEELFNEVFNQLRKARNTP